MVYRPLSVRMIILRLHLLPFEILYLLKESAIKYLCSLVRLLISFRIYSFTGSDSGIFLQTCYYCCKYFSKALHQFFKCLSLESQQKDCLQVHSFRRACCTTSVCALCLCETAADSRKHKCGRLEFWLLMGVFRYNWNTNTNSRLLLQAMRYLPEQLGTLIYSIPLNNAGFLLPSQHLIWRPA